MEVFFYPFSLRLVKAIGDSQSWRGTIVVKFRWNAIRKLKTFHVYLFTNLSDLSFPSSILRLVHFVSEQHINHLTTIPEELEISALKPYYDGCTRRQLVAKYHSNGPGRPKSFAHIEQCAGAFSQEGLVNQNSSPLFFRKIVEIERFPLRAAILHECQNYLGGGCGLKKKKKNRGTVI